MSELNLLPPYLKDKRRHKVNIRNYILMGIIAVCFALFLIYIPVSGLLRVRAEESKYRLQSEQADDDAIKKENENVKKKIDYYKEYVEKVEQLEESKTMVSSRIHELEQFVPEDIVFDSLNYGEKGLTINATAKSMDSISEFTANLQRSGSYKNVRVSNITLEKADSKTKNEVYKFTINAAK